MLIPGELPIGDDSVLITTMSRLSVGNECIALGASAGATAWPAANLITYVPFRVERPRIAYKVISFNGAPSGTIAVGLYDRVFNKMDSGSGTQTGTSTGQAFDITDQPLWPGGMYYMAVTLDNTTATMRRIGIGGTPLLPLVVLSEAGSGGLPATGTPAYDYTTTNSVPLLGVMTRSSYL